MAIVTKARSYKGNNIKEKLSRSLLRSVLYMTFVSIVFRCAACVHKIFVQICEKPDWSPQGVPAPLGDSFHRETKMDGWMDPSIKVLVKIGTSHCLHPSVNLRENAIHVCMNECLSPVHIWWFFLRGHAQRECFAGSFIF